MDKYQELLYEFLTNKTLNDIEFFDIDLKYFSPDINHLWIVDGGIQMQLDNDYFSFAWMGELDIFNSYFQKIESRNADQNFKRLGARNLNSIKYLIGNKIVKVDSKWNFYQEINNDLESVGEKKFMPMEIILYFNDQSFIQMATVDYDIEDVKLENVWYDSEGELLISLNRWIEIKTDN